MTQGPSGPFSTKGISMEYGSYTDEELRRVLNADDRDVDAIIEAAERFRKASHEADDSELEDARKEGYDEGYSEGYEEGYAEGEREDDSR